jgi:cellulose synthase/poly-beta-1,6-N-acetylglucosamine synthase-like glycosyltransferase
LLGDDVPHVDVFITCCREDVNIILDTVRATLAMDYPNSRFNVIVLDDGGSSDLENAIKSLSAFSNLYYTTREKKSFNFKAGNLNYGMDFSASIREKGQAAEFIAGIDADMLPDVSFLRALLPHLLQDHKVALVNPPQRFYNMPRGDPLHQGIHLFYDCTELIKTTIDAGWCHGTGWIVRRHALEEIGGFPAGTLSEDICCSTLLWGSGWKTRYVHEDLQYGVVPDSYYSHVKQQTRWVSLAAINFKPFC